MNVPQTSTLVLPVLLLSLSTACQRTPQQQEARFLKKAQELTEKKDYARAAIELANAAKAAPEDAEPWYRLGLNSLSAGNLKAAASAFRKATDLNPNHAQAQLQLSRFMTVGSDPDLLKEAQKRLDRVLSSDPANTLAADTMAVADLKLGKIEEGAARLEKVLAQFPASLHSSVTLARFRLAQNDWKGAEKALVDAVRSAPNSAGAAVALGSFYATFNKPEQAEPVLRRALQLRSDDAVALSNLASVLARTNRMRDAEEVFRRLASLGGEQYRPAYGMFLYMSGRKEEALQEFKRIATKWPDSRTDRDRLIACLVDMNRLADAATLLESILNDNSRDADALQWRALLSLRQRKYAEAEKDLNDALHFRPDSLAIHLALASVHRARGSVQMEQKELDEVLRLNPSNAEARFLLSRLHLTRNRPATALDVIDKAPQAVKGSTDVAVQRNWALLMEGRLAEAQKAVEEGLRAGRRPDLLVQQATIYMRQRAFAKAQASATEALALDGTDVRAVSVLADALIAANQTATAMDRLRGIAAKQPQSAPVQHVVGQYLVRAGRRSEGQTAFERAIAADGGFLPALLGLADLSISTRDFDAAQGWLDRASASHPNNVPVLLQRARLQQAAGNLPAAEAAYRAVIDVDSRNVVALNNLAGLQAVHSPEAALNLALQALEIAPDSPVVNDTVGWIHYRQNQFIRAVPFLERVVTQQPTPRSYYHLGLTFVRAGQRQRGEELLQKALAKDPQLPKTERDW